MSQEIQNTKKPDEIPPDWMIIYMKERSTHEEHDCSVIYETMDGEFWLEESSYNVYNGSHEEFRRITEDEAINFLIEEKGC